MSSDVRDACERVISLLEEELSFAHVI